MKSKFFTSGITFLFVILLIQSFSFAQSVWTTQYLGNINGNNLRRIQFVNLLTGYAAGGHGTFVKTTNGGDTWTQINLGTTTFVNTIFFLNANTGWVGTASSLILKTNDGGASWSFQTFPNGTALGSIYFFNDQTGYSAGKSTGLSQFAWTTNGGTNWTVRSTSTFAWGEARFVNQLTGWIEAPDYFAKTTNGGVNWTRLLYDGSNQDFYFLNDQTGWVASEYLMKKTVNGGESWSFYQMPVGTPYAVRFFNQNTGWCAGNTYNNGLICCTTNGGLSWGTQKIETNNSFYDISFVNANTGWSCGNSIIASTTDGTLTSVNQISTNTPEKFSLKQNYPNPFNPSTRINFDIKNSSFTSLKVFDMTGKEVKSLVNENLAAGSYEINFNSAELNSGVYFYTLRTKDFNETKKMMLVK